MAFEAETLTKRVDPSVRAVPFEEVIKKL